MSLIIELKENQSVKNDEATKHINGKFNISLKNNLTLNNGDTLNIRNIFIDSTQTAGEILVKTDTTLTMEFVKGATLCYDMTIGSDRTKSTNDNYILLGEQTSYNINNNFFTPSGNTPGNPLRVDMKVNIQSNAGVNNGDTFTYYPCKSINPNTATTGKAVTITFQPVLEGNNSISSYGGVTVQFEYTNIDNKKETLFLKLDEVNITEPTHTQNLTAFEKVVYILADDIVAVNPTPKQLYDKYNIRTYNFNHEAIPADDSLVLLKSTISVTIPGGKSYNPSTLAELLTYEFNKVNDISKTVPFDNNTDNRSVSLFTENNEQSKLNSIYGSTFYNGDPIRWYVAEDGGSYIIVQNNWTDGGNTYFSNELYGGCDSFAIIYDETTQSFKIPNLHSPFYLDIGGPDAHPPNFDVGHQIKSKYVTENSGQGIDNDSYLFYNDTKRGDIIITGLYSSNLDDSDNSNFWFDELGFSPSIITTTGYDNYLFTPLDANVSVPVFEKKLGVNSTDVLIEQNVKMLKNKFTFNIFNDYTTSGAQFINSQTTEIISDKSISQLSEKEGYYIVKIKANYASNKLYTSNSTEIISAIVSKYYTNSGYSTGFSSDGIIYIHRGSSIAISEFDIEILDSNKNNPVDLGPDSSIYIEITPGEAEK